LRIQTNFIEQVIKHTQTAGNISGAGRAAVVGHLHHAKFTDDLRVIGKPHLRAIHSQYAVAAPSPTMCSMFSRVESWHNARLVQFDESCMFEFRARLRPSPAVTLADANS